MIPLRKATSSHSSPALKCLDQQIPVERVAATVPSPSALKATLTFVTASLRVGLRDKTVFWLAMLFMAMVLVSAYLGWSATRTVNQIYDQASVAFQAQGKELPPNPLGELPPLSMLRNMTTYVALLGVLVSIVLGSQLVQEDRRSGAFSLIASRPVPRMAYALGKVGALVIIILGTLLVAALVNAIAISVLPSAPKTADTWLGLGAFYSVSALFIMFFGLMAVASAAATRSESVGLLIPIIAWLAMTFVFPQLSSNINPMAALNPMSATVEQPSGIFFQATGLLLAPLSLTSAYRDLSAFILGFMPDDLPGPDLLTKLLMLSAADLLAAAAAVFTILRLDATRSYTDE